MIDAALRGVGLAGAVTVVTERRGQLVLRVDGPEGAFRVKTAVDTDDGYVADTAAVEREFVALSMLPDYATRCEPHRGTVDGRPVVRTRWLTATPLDLATPTGFRAAAGALAHVHAHGFVHGDVQPGHIMMIDGMATLLDFGLAHHTAVPLAGYRGGLVHFNAPELCASIAACGSGPATPAIDVYALGASALYVATGRFPVAYASDATYAAVIEAIASTAPELEPLRACAPPDLATAIAACLAPTRERPADAGALVAMLAQ